MVDGTPLVLIASVSPDEGRLLERGLKKTGWDLLRVEDAEDASRQLDGSDGRPALVIDAGLLQMAHDSQWRDLRSRHPTLATVVRCLVPRRPKPGGGLCGAVEVSPDDLQGICEAIRTLVLSGHVTPAQADVGCRLECP